MNNHETNKMYICITACINTHQLEVSTETITSLEEVSPMLSISDNRAYGSHRIYNMEKIIEINSMGETEQVYTKTPNNNGEWCELY